MDDAIRQAVISAMHNRGVGQLDLARQSGLSQGHRSKVLRSLPMGRRTRDRLQKWLDDPELSDRERAIDADELVRIGSLLKQRCDELAMISRLVATQMRLRDNSPGQ